MRCLPQCGNRLAIITIAAYLVVVGFVAYPALLYVQNTVFVYNPPEGSLVYRAETIAKASLGGVVMQKPLYVVLRELQSVEGECVEVIENPLLQSFTDELVGEIGSEALRIEGFGLIPPGVGLRRACVGGRCNSSTLFLLEARGGLSELTSRVRAFATSFVASHNATFAVDFTSERMIADDLVHGILGDLGVIDAVAVPISFLIFALCLKSVQLVIIPLISIVSSVVLSFAIMYPVALTSSVSSFAPEMSTAVIVALSIDYALFMASRFQEEVEHRAALDVGDPLQLRRAAVAEAWEKSLHNIATSGVTIAIALGSLHFMPVPFVASIGVAFLVGALVSVVVSLTLTPALLFIGFAFFAGQQRCLCSIRRAKSPHPGDDVNTMITFRLERRSLLSGELPETGGDPHKAFVREWHAAEVASPWYRMALWVTAHPVFTAAVILGLGVPFFYESFQLQTNFDLFTSVQRGSPSALLLREVMSSIGHGAAVPVYVVLRAAGPGAVLTEPFFEAMQNITDAIVEGVGQPVGGVVSIARYGDVRITAAQADELLNVHNDIGDAYRYAFNGSVSSDRRVAVVRLQPPVDVFGGAMGPYFDDLDRVLTAQQHRFDAVDDVAFFGASAVSWALMRSVTSHFLMLMGITLGIIVIVIGLVFRSFFVPVRMLITVLYTLGMSFGAGTLIFQHEWLHPIWPAMRDVTAYNWSVPVFAFSLLCALALDYDIFLLTRIVERKKEGHPDPEAIAGAVSRTGRVISCAGLIMAISFGSMVFSSVTMLNQFGAISAFAVLIDTFVVRPLLVPALMSVFPRIVWYPRQFSAPVMSHDFDDD